jgi:hypothetical protein
MRGEEMDREGGELFDVLRVAEFEVHYYGVNFTDIMVLGISWNFPKYLSKNLDIDY